MVNNNSGFATGFSHPILGLDHFLVMLGVGLWGAQMQGRRMWSLPITFPIIMSLGAILKGQRLKKITIKNNRENDIWEDLGQVNFVPLISDNY